MPITENFTAPASYNQAVNSWKLPVLLTIATTSQPATNLGYLLHKHPQNLQTAEESFGKISVFYSEAREDYCQICLLLDINPVALTRNKVSHYDFASDRYVNDRPYVASSFMSKAIASVFKSALNGNCKEKPELVDTPMAFSATLSTISCAQGLELIQRLFTPLGYKISAQELPLDEAFPQWGASPYFDLTLEATCTLRNLLCHLYVLIPVLDNKKHYFVDDSEVTKLMSKASEWLPEHPEKKLITNRYLKHKSRLTQEALALLNTEEICPESLIEQEKKPDQEMELELPLSLNEERLTEVLKKLKEHKVTAVADLGCGEGNFLKLALKEGDFKRLAGVDASLSSLEKAEKRLNLERHTQLKLLHGALTYRDSRLNDYESLVCLEVIEHIDLPRLKAFEKVLFQYPQAKLIIVTTPNREYNALFPGLASGTLRHRDHRFEWTRQEFQNWAQANAEKYGFTVSFTNIGKEDAELGSPTQMGIFTR